jgi:hypothetical protein
MEAGLPDTTSDAASEGTLMHKAAEDLFLNSVSPLGLDEEQEAAVESAVRQAKEAMAGCRLSGAERRLEFVDAGGVRYFGTADIVGFKENDAAVICELKFGRVKVAEAAGNIQGAAYALAAAQEYGCDKAEVFIIQPRVSSTPSRWQFTNFKALESSIVGIIDAADVPDAPCNPSEEACKYCKAFGSCPAAQREALAIADRTRVDVSMLTAPMLSAMSERLGLACKFYQEVIKPEIKRRISLGDAVHGWEIKPGSKRREADADQLYGADIGKHLTPNEYAACCKVSIPKVKEAWVSKEAAASGATKKDAGKVFDEVTAYAVSVTQGEPKLVRAGETEEVV